MARHTFVLDGGYRLEISQSENAGGVVLKVFEPARTPVITLKTDASTAAVIAQALGLEAAAAENAAQCCTTPRPDCMGMLVPSIGNGCKALQEDLGALETLYSNREKYGTGFPLPPAKVQAYADTNGVPPGRALPVVDVPQVGA